MKLVAWKIRKGDRIIFKYGGPELVLSKGRCEPHRGRRKRVVFTFARPGTPNVARMECEADSEYEVTR